MKDNRRLILKQLLRGNVSAGKLATELGGVASEYLPIFEMYPDHKLLISDAVRKQKVHILEQLNEAYEAKIPTLRFIESSFDFMKNIFTTETDEEQEARFGREYLLITDKQDYDSLRRLIEAEIR